METLSLLQSPLTDNFSLERSLYTSAYSFVAGTDEVGRGPLAGPVVAAAVILPQDFDHSIFIDSKALSHKKRLALLETLREIDAQIGIGVVSEQKIDEINILQASLLAMKKSIQALSRKYQKPDFLLVDGKFTVPMRLPQAALIKGESKSASIAAASIVAKEHRDALMAKLDAQYPQYGFAQHSGYPTKKHREVLAKIGPCPHHRTSFKGVKEYVNVSQKSGQNR